MLQTAIWLCDSYLCYVFKNILPWVCLKTPPKKTPPLENFEKRLSQKPITSWAIMEYNLFALIMMNEKLRMMNSAFSPKFIILTQQSFFSPLNLYLFLFDKSTHHSFLNPILILQFRGIQPQNHQLFHTILFPSNHK